MTNLPEQSENRRPYLPDAVLTSYAGIFFSSSRWAGLLLLAGTFFDLRVGLYGLTGVVLSIAACWLWKLPDGMIRGGLFGYNVLLVSLGCGAILPQNISSIGIFLLVAAITIPVTAAMRGMLGKAFNLPVLSMPFLLVFLFLIGSLKLCNGCSISPHAAQSYLENFVPCALSAPLEALGSIFFLPRADAGLFILLAMLVSSRIAAMLVILAMIAAAGVCHTIPGASDPAIVRAACCNSAFTAVAIGGVFFIPSISSYLLAVFAAAAAAWITAGLWSPMAWMQLPVLILPFNITTALILAGMAQRTRNASPIAAELLASPEENLGDYQARIARFGDYYGIRFSLPFLGQWICTQGIGGGYTHKGPWRYGFDFEVCDAEGRLFRNAGSAVSDYLCYRLPILAGAGGTVARVIDGIPDNPPGQVNLLNNWGNAVIVCHTPSRYSLVAHLAPGSIKVAEGQPVRPGQVLGLCGNSGRSPRPHLHFQWQASAYIGDPGIDGAFSDVINASAGYSLLRRCQPNENDRLRNIEQDSLLAGLFRFSPDCKMRFSVSNGKYLGEEAIIPEVIGCGESVLKSRKSGSRIHCTVDETFFTLFETIGRRDQILHILRISLGCVPFEKTAGLQWTDRLPWHYLMPGWKRLLLEPALPFYGERGIEMTYRMDWQGSQLTISGRSGRRHRGRPLIESSCILENQKGIQCAEVCIAGHTIRADAISDASAESKGDSQ